MQVPSQTRSGLTDSGRVMTLETHHDCRYFVSYSGVTLPLNLVNLIPPEALSNRNTFIRAYFNKAGMLTSFEKLVYGEVELSHRYEYHDDGSLRSAEISMLDEEPVIMFFNKAGKQII